MPHKSRISLVAQVGVASGIFFLIFGFVLTRLVSDFVARNFQAQTESSISNFLEKQVYNYLNAQDFEHRRRSREDIEVEHHIFGPFMSAIRTDEVVKIRVWDGQGAIIHSHKDEPGEIDFDDINREFPDNEHYLAAMQGLVSTEISSNKTAEDEDLGQYGEVMEVYIPVYLEGREMPVGVAEVYYKLDSLNANIASINRNIFIFTGSTFVLLYAVLLFITKRASDTIKAQGRKIEEVHRSQIEKSKEVLKLKNDFFFIATHDLKTPVTAIEGFVRLIKDRTDELPGDIEESFDAIQEASKRLTALVADLLEVARGDSGTLKVKMEPVDLKGVLEKVMDELSQKAKERGIIIKKELTKGKITVLGNEQKLAEVFENLLSNAVKYNQENGKIKVSTRKVGDMLEVEVADTGIGITEEEQKKVFTKFFRSEKRDARKVSGTGLGLFIVSMLVEKMKGKISFQSREGKGTTFTVKLPLVKS